MGVFIGDEASKQEWLIGRTEVWEKKHRYNQQNCSKTSTGELRGNLACNPIGMDIHATSDKGHGVFIHESGENSPQNLLASPFLRKQENHPPRRRNLKYDAGQEIWPGYPKSGDFGAQKFKSSQHTIVELIDVVK